MFLKTLSAILQENCEAQWICYIKCILNVIPSNHLFVRTKGAITSCVWSRMMKVVCLCKLWNVDRTKFTVYMDCTLYVIFSTQFLARKIKISSSSIIRQRFQDYQCKSYMSIYWKSIENPSTVLLINLSMYALNRW